jgi:D-alanyl-D-alanine carboxypeptidase
MTGARKGRKMSSFRILVVGVVASVAICGGSATASPVATPKKHANLQALARGLVKAGAPGALVYVRTPTGVRSAAAGFANLAPRATMRTSHRYRVASVTKTFVSTVVLQLEAEGKLRVDDSVERWLPGLVPNGTSISLRELLNHTSGLFDYNEDQQFGAAILANPGRQWAPRELLAFALAHSALFAPGTNWSYSNTNYILLGLVIEAVTGHKLAGELQTRILGPLALGATSFPTGISIDGSFAHGYVRLAPGGDLIDTTPVLDPSFSWAAGGIVSNAGDLTKFFSSLLKGRLLPAAQLKEMKTGSRVSGVYGLGLRMSTTKCGRVFGHDGAFPGYRTIVWATSSGRRVAVVMINTNQGLPALSKLQPAAVTALCSG